MATLSSATRAGHNPKGERNTAGVLYIALFFAVVSAAAAFLMLTWSDRMNPYKVDRPEFVAPDVNPSAPGDRSGAVAAPQSDKVPVPESKSVNPSK